MAVLVILQYSRGRCERFDIKDRTDNHRRLKRILRSIICEV